MPIFNIHVPLGENSLIGRISSLFCQQLLPPMSIECRLEKEKPIPFGEVSWYEKFIPYVMNSFEYRELYGSIDEYVDPFVYIVWLGFVLSTNVLSQELPRLLYLNKTKDIKAYRVVLEAENKQQNHLTECDVIVDKHLSLEDAVSLMESHKALIPTAYSFNHPSQYWFDF